MAGACAFYLAASTGCDVLWSPYEQQVLLPEGGVATDDLGTDLSPPPWSTTDGGQSYPATCAEASSTGQPSSGTVTLYVGGDPAKPWTALCELAGTQVQEFLPLPKPTNNYAQYTTGGSATGSSVRTTYSALRINPQTLVINCGDQTHTSSTGQVNHPNMPNPIAVTSMPYGVAMGCNMNANGLGQIDLTGTPFAVAPNAFMNEGNMPMGNASYGAGNRTVNLTGGGYCGWLDPKPGDNNPFNADTKIALQLVYSPM